MNKETYFSYQLVSIYTMLDAILLSQSSSSSTLNFGLITPERARKWSKATFQVTSTLNLKSALGACILVVGDSSPERRVLADRHAKLTEFKILLVKREVIGEVRLCQV